MTPNYHHIDLPRPTAGPAVAFYTSIDLTESIGYGVDLVVNVAFHDMERGWGFVNETTKINDQNPGLVVGAGFTPYGEALTRGSLIYREHYTEGEHGPPPASVSDALTLWFQVSLLNDHAILSFLWLNRLTPCHPRRRGNQRNHRRTMPGGNHNRLVYSVFCKYGRCSAEPHWYCLQPRARGSGRLASIL